MVTPVVADSIGGQQRRQTGFSPYIPFQCEPLAPAEHRPQKIRTRAPFAGSRPLPCTERMTHPNRRRHHAPALQPREWLQLPIRSGRPDRKSPDRRSSRPCRYGQRSVPPRMASVHAVMREGSRRSDHWVVPSSARIRGTATPTDESVKRSTSKLAAPGRRRTSGLRISRSASGRTVAAAALMAAA